MASQALQLADPRPTPVLPHVGFSPLRLTEGATSTGGIPPVSFSLSVLLACRDETKVGHSRRRIPVKDESATHQALSRFLQRSSLRPVCAPRSSTLVDLTDLLGFNHLLPSDPEAFEAASEIRPVPHFHRCFFGTCHSLIRIKPTGCLHPALGPQYCLREVSPSLGA